jgi:hypothetical protein
MDIDPDEPSEKPTGHEPPPDEARAQARRRRQQSDRGGDSDTTGDPDAGNTPPSGTRGDPNQGTGEGVGDEDPDTARRSD